MKLLINSQESKSKAIGTIATLWPEKKYIRISIAFGKDRSLEQNSLLHKWFQEIAEQRGENTAAEVKVICKRKFFIPILRADDEEFNKIIISLKGMPEEQKVRLIELLPVTSICSVKQMKQGMDDMNMHYTEMGVVLTDPADDLGQTS